MDNPIKPPTLTDAGEPAVFFFQEEIENLCQPFVYSVIAKCSYDRLSIPEVKQIISFTFQLKSGFVSSILDARQLVFRFNNEVTFC